MKEEILFNPSTQIGMPQASSGAQLAPELKRIRNTRKRNCCCTSMWIAVRQRSTTIRHFCPSGGLSAISATSRSTEDGRECMTRCGAVR